jgi:hypothetical protein
VFQLEHYSDSQLAGTGWGMVAINLEEIPGKKAPQHLLRKVGTAVAFPEGENLAPSAPNPD